MPGLSLGSWFVIGNVASCGVVVEYVVPIWLRSSVVLMALNARLCRNWNDLNKSKVSS